MRVSATSDTHGDFEKNHPFTDIIIHSGDFLPDPPRLMDFHSNAIWQENWVINNIPKVKKWLEDKPLFFIFGNHDYMSADKFEEICRANGIRATNIENKIVSINNFTMYGFPWIKKINGRFNYELNNVQMKQKCDELKQVLESQFIDALVAHGAMTNGLSNEGYCDYGNQYLEEMINSMDKDFVPNYMFVGHLHAANGIKFKQELNMLVVNSATTCHSIEV